MVLHSTKGGKKSSLLQILHGNFIVINLHKMGVLNSLAFLKITKLCNHCSAYLLRKTPLASTWELRFKWDCLWEAWLLVIMLLTVKERNKALQSCFFSGKVPFSLHASISTTCVRSFAAFNINSVFHWIPYDSASLKHTDNIQIIWYSLSTPHCNLAQFLIFG